VTVLRTTPTIQFTANVSGARGKTIHATFSLAAAPQITSNLNMVGVTGSPVSYQIACDTSGVTYGATGLPQGLSINPTTGLITGVPTESGTYSATLAATNASGRTGYATLMIQTGSSLSSLSSIFGASTTWVCPANVTAVQVEAWGGGGAGGSGVRGSTSKSAVGGGGAGGAYARLNSYPVVPGRTYYINVGAGGESSTNNLATVAGGDSWFNSNNVTSTLVLAKGGPGGQSIVNNNVDTFGTGGVGTASGSIGDVVRAGGSGATSTTNAFGGGGGGSAGTASVGNAPASTLDGLGAVAVTGGGNGGNANASSGSSGDGQSPTGAPGGGGGGARAASTSQRYGGTGAAGQITLTVQAMAKISQTITFGLDPAAGQVGDAARTLIATSSSGLPVTLASSDSNVATITSGNTLNFVGAGTVTITATQVGNTNYDAAIPVPVIFTVGASIGATFSGVFGSGVDPAGIGTDGLAYLMKYSLGGTNTNDKVSLPTVSINGSTLTMTAVVRTNDTNVQIVGQWIPDLTGTWSNTPTNPYGRASTNSNNVPTGCQRRDFSVEKDTNSRLFLRLKASQ